MPVPVQQRVEASTIRLAAKGLTFDDCSLENDVNRSFVEDGFDCEVTSYKRLEACQWRPLVLRHGDIMLFLLHGTKVNWRNIFAATRTAIFGTNPHAAYGECKYHLERMMARHRPRQVVVAGHSLGGSLADMLVVDFTSRRPTQLSFYGVDSIQSLSFDSPSFCLSTFLTFIDSDGNHDKEAMIAFKAAPHVINTSFQPLAADVRRVEVAHIEDTVEDGVQLGCDILECTFDGLSLAVPALKGHWGKVAQAGFTNASAKIAASMVWSKVAWIRRQHDMQQIYKHLDNQFRIHRWPNQEDVVWPILDGSQVSWEYSVPLFGPAYRIRRKLMYDDWIQDNETVRSSIEELVQGTRNFLQDSVPMQTSPATVSR